MTRPQDCHTADDRLPPDCRVTILRLHELLDGRLPLTALATDAHVSTCLTCQDRLAAAQALLRALATPARSGGPPIAPIAPDLTERILRGVQEQRQRHLRWRAYAVAAAACIAIVGTVAILHQLAGSTSQPNPGREQPTFPSTPQVADGSAPAVPPPVRIGDELTRASLALRDSSRPLTEPAAVAPQLVVRLTDTLTRPLLADPDFAPARLGDLSQAARTGLEPITGTAQKAFARLLRDVNAVTTKPK
jgi:hypothetical protein